jgi:hypothetical protein
MTYRFSAALLAFVLAGSAATGALAQELEMGLDFGLSGEAVEMPTNTQPGDIGQSTLPRARVTDPEQVAFLMDRFLIFDDSVSYIEIIDVTRNGFGPDDIAVTFPSQRTHFLGEFVDSLAQSLMVQWKFEAEYTQDAAFNASPDFFDPAFRDSVREAQILERARLLDEDRQAEIVDSLLMATPPDTLRQGAAQSAILANLMRAIGRNYDAEPVSLLYERDANGFTFQLWNFEEEAMEYVPPPPPLQLIDTVFAPPSAEAIAEAATGQGEGPPRVETETVTSAEGLTRYDLLQLLQQDSLIQADAQLYDLLQVYTSDSLITAEGVEEAREEAERERRRSGRIYPWTYTYRWRATEPQER